MSFIRKHWRKLLAVFRLNLEAVCEESVGLGPWEDYHDYPDSEERLPTHFSLLRCKRCGKDFYI
jgi:hypothetical protein